MVFENRAAEPIDVFYYNGTCEELVSWDEIGGVAPLGRKPLLSTQGHSFRLRSAADRRLLMAHTMSDLVIKGCDDEAEGAAHRQALDGLESLRIEARLYEREAEVLRQRLSNALAEMAELATSGRQAATVPYGGALGALFGQWGVNNATKAAAAVDAAGGSYGVDARTTLGGLLQVHSR